MKKEILNSPFPRRGKPNSELEAISKLSSPVRSLAGSLAELIKSYNLDFAEINLTGKSGGKVVIKNSKKGKLSVRLGGSFCSDNQPVAGTPYVAHYNGEFFWRPTPESEDFVKNGDMVRSGQMIGWAMGESKDMSFGIRADRDGIINIIAPNASKVRKDETVLYYIEESE